MNRRSFGLVGATVLVALIVTSCGPLFVNARTIQGEYAYVGSLDGWDEELSGAQIYLGDAVGSIEYGDGTGYEFSYLLEGEVIHCEAADGPGLLLMYERPASLVWLKSGATAYFVRN